MTSDNGRTLGRYSRMILAFVVAALAALLVGRSCDLRVQEDPHRQRVTGFLQGVLAVTSSFETPVAIPASNIPSTPLSLCTIYDYEGIEEIKAFLGSARFDELSATYRMQDRKSAIVFVYNSSVMPIASDSLGQAHYFIVDRTTCSPANAVSLVVVGKRIALQPLH